MATEPAARPQGWPEPDAKGYERSDVRAKWIGGVVAFLAIGAIAIHFILHVQLQILAKRPPTRDIWSTPTRFARPEFPTNAPRLQLSAPADLAAFRSREDAELNTYGWVNKTQGIVRIPIQQAMNLIVEKNLLPIRKGTNAVSAGRSTLQLQQERGTRNGNSTSNTVAHAVTPPAASAIASAVTQVSMRNLQFHRATLEVKPGDVVEWRNDDLVPHTATSASFSSGTIVAGQSWRHTFTNAGNFSYVCSFHPQMKGVVVVK